jgi:hypothetical protein
MQRYRLGRLPEKPHAKTMMLAKYLTGELPAPAEKVFREYKVPAEAKLMFGNDTIGDCTCAAMANLIILTTCHTGKVVIPTAEDVIAVYSAVGGYDPSRTDADGNNPTDNGAAMTDVLAYMQTTGMAGHKILAWAKIDQSNLEHRRIGCDLFGCTYVGVNLPTQAQQQFSEGEPRAAVYNDTIEGGHAILRPGYGSLGDDYVTWAKWDQKASADWSLAYVEEEYVVITEDWIDQATQKTPGGLDLAALKADLGALRA